MRFGKRKQNSSRKVGLLSLFAVLLSLGMLSGGLAYARYIHQSDYGGVAVSREFYFSSDLLDEDGGAYTLSPGATEVTFYLCNHDDDLRSSKLYVYYDVTVDNGATVTFSDSKKQIESNSVKHDAITVSGLQPGKSYTITATTEGTRSKYGKTLSMTVTVPETTSAVYKALDSSNSEYVLLTVWSQGYQGEVTITPPAGVIPDNTDPVMTTAQTGEAFTDSTSFSSASYNSYTYRFFGNGVKVSDFIVTYDDGEKTAAAQELLD